MIRDIIKFALIILLIVVPIRTFVAQPFIVNGASMDPTFGHGEYLIVDQITYRFNDPKRGDVVVFRYPEDPRQFFIKRIIGLPGESLSISNSTVTIHNQAHPDGLDLEEPYIEFPRNESLNVELGEDEYYVLGDNRVASSDSRSWGALDSDLIVGRPLMRLLPHTSISLFPGMYHEY